MSTRVGDGAIAFADEHGSSLVYGDLCRADLDLERHGVMP